MIRIDSGGIILRFFVMILPQDVSSGQWSDSGHARQRQAASAAKHMTSLLGTKKTAHHPLPYNYYLVTHHFLSHGRWGTV